LLLLSQCCQEPAGDDEMVIVVPGTCTFPPGSSAASRIEWDIAERANPATSALWHRPHPLGSIDSMALFAARETRAGVSPVGVGIWVCAVKPPAATSAIRPDRSEIIRLAVIGGGSSSGKVDLQNEKSLQELSEGHKKAQSGEEIRVLFGRALRRGKF
jgi:hypothetical protein